MQRFAQGAWKTCWSLLLALGLSAGVAAGQETDGVSRKEFNDLKKKYENLQKEVKDLRGSAVRSDTLDERMDNLSDEIEDYLQKSLDGVAAARPGTTNFVLTGYATAGYTDESMANGTFGATFNPIFLWKLGEKLFFEGELEFELEDGDTEVGLEYGLLSYTPTDWLTISGGKFLNPFGIFRERLHPAWINKLPDKPLGYSGGANKLVQSTRIGFQARGAFRFQNGMHLSVVVYVTNGPTLTTADPAKFGLLGLKNFSDTNNNKAVGGRIGFVPIPELEIGYSFDFSQVTPSGSGVADADLVMQGFDASFHKESKAIHGTIDVRFEFLLSDVDDVIYDPTGAIGFGPTTYRNERTAWYIQVAFRPTLVSSEVLKNLEIVYRFDTIDHPSAAPSGVDETRSTIGINYWLGPSTVLKFAVRIDATKGGPDTNAFLLQWVIGF